MKRYLMKITRQIMLVLSLASIVSCTDDWQEAAEVEVNFTAALPAEARSRAYGDGTGVDCLVVRLYDEYKNHIFTQSYPVEDQEVSFQLSLAKNKKFHLIFWAYNSRNDVYQWDDLTSIRMEKSEYTSWEEAEGADAFYSVIKDFMVNGSDRTQYISLTRPLAQINVGTGGEILPIAFTIHSPTTFHPLEGAVSGALADYSWTFDGTSTESFEVDNVSYHYLAVGYVFAPVGESMNASLALTNTDNGHTVEFPVVKLQANHRCNIVGNVNP
jgi:hypothetical protein